MILHVNEIIKKVIYDKNKDFKFFKHVILNIEVPSLSALPGFIPFIITCVTKYIKVVCPSRAPGLISLVEVRVFQSLDCEPDMDQYVCFIPLLLLVLWFEDVLMYPFFILVMPVPIFIL